jgi:hypothetical protein
VCSKPKKARIPKPSEPQSHDFAAVSFVQLVEFGFRHPKKIT